MIDLASLPVFDHHCHPYDPAKAVLEPWLLAREFHHGMRDIPSDKAPNTWGMSEELRYHFKNMGVVNTMVCQLARVFKCPAELDVVTQERNRRASADFAGYARFLYEDAKIVGTVLDTGLPKNDPLLNLIPGKKFRLFQVEPLLQKLLTKAESYQELLREFQENLEQSVKKEGFIGVKVHLAEQVGFGVMPVLKDEATSIFPQAKTGNANAYKKLYTAVFTAIMLQCQELGVPVHLHGGFTGGMWNGPIYDSDPFLLAPFLRRPEFLKTKLVFLHAGYPWTKQAGQLAHTFPNVWVDMSQVSPWASLLIAECYRDVMAWAPLSKIVIGSGGHGTPEIAWLAALTAKIALTEVLTDAVRLGLMASKSAEEAARMILRDNAARLYRLEGT
ncbi:MAG: amidohydrolase family protein [Chloroflexota bacterium]